MVQDNLKLVEKCFRDARITDEICDSTEKKYKSSIGKFFSIIGDKKIEDLSNSDFDNFILRMKDGGAGGARIRNVISAMVWILNKMQDNKIIFNNLNLLTIKKPKIMRKEINYLNDKEIAQLVNCIRNDFEKKPTVKNIRLMAFVMLLFQTGARIGEILSINISDIDRQNKEIKIIGKGNKPRTLFLRDEILSWIDRYLKTRGDSSGALFVTQDGTSRWKQTDAGRSFRKFRKLSGIKKKFTIHTLRHTFATQYLMKGAGINVVQAALGHSDAMTTLRFYAGAAEKVKVKEMINDRHFDFIPENTLKQPNNNKVS